MARELIGQGVLDADRVISGIWFARQGNNLLLLSAGDAISQARIRFFFLLILLVLGVVSSRFRLAVCRLLL